MIKARYTFVLKNMMDDEHIRPLLDKALSTYPLYVKKSKEEYIPSIVPTREQLNTKILNAYKYREIGFETIARFLDELEISMNEIMPYYNQMLFSADQDFNILFNVDYQRTTTADKTGTRSETSTGTGTATGTSTDSQITDSEATDSSTGTTTGNNNSKTVKSDTPQDSLNITAANIDSVGYANEVTWNKDNTSGDSTTTGESTSKVTTSGNTSNSNESEFSNETTGTDTENEKILETTKGNFGVVSSQDLILKYREIIMNIEQMIINDERISELFMRVF